jgi:16S rRNA (cytosine967-C5)-methyltransferase
MNNTVRKEAFKIITKVFKKKLFSDKLLHQSAKKMQKEDENYALLYHLVKGVIKYRKNLDYIITQFTDPTKYKKTSLKIKVILYMAIFQLRYMNSGTAHSVVDNTVLFTKKNLDQKVANFINAVLRSYLRNPQITYPQPEASNIANRYSFPEDLVEKWLQQWGRQNTVELCKFFNRAPSLHLRVNNMATEPGKVIGYFKRRDIELKQVDFVPNFLVARSGSKIIHDVALSEGYLSIQDPAAGLVVDLVDPEDDSSVLDLFAAPGGKATYLAEKMKNTGELIAVDKYPKKTKKLKKAVERLQISNMKIVTEDAFNYKPVAPAYDRVLLDVPCSGWGVFQKKAELRWQQHQEMKQLLKLQKRALNFGAKFVKPGGQLIYSTCTLNEQENEQQVEYFLQHHDDFKLLDAGNFVSNLFTENKYLKTLPFKHKLDGAFAAKMVKI